MKLPFHKDERAGHTIYQPKVPIKATGPVLVEPQDVLLDTGGDITWLLTDAPLPPIVGKMSQGGITADVAFAELAMTIQNDGETFTWHHRVAISNADTGIIPVLGWYGFLQYFNITLDTYNKFFTIEPNELFRSVGTKNRLFGD